MEVGINRKHICDFLLVINSNWHPISYRFGVIAAYCSNIGHSAFLSHPLGLRYNVRCSSWAHWKARSWLPISVIIELFSLGVTTEALRVNIGLKSAISLQRGPVDPKFQAEVVAPTNYSFARKTRLNDLSYGIGQIFLPLCHNWHVWQTDRQTDRQNSHRYTASAFHAVW